MEKNGHILSRYRFLIWLALFLFWAGPAAAPFLRSGASYALAAEDDLTLDRILLNIKTREQSLKTFTASFRQTQKNSLLQAPLVSQGMLFYDQSGSILMKISHPEAFVLLIRDRLMVMGDPLTKTFKQKKIPGRDAFVKRYLGTGRSIEALKETYDIRIVHEHAGNGCQLDLIPKNASRRLPYQSIRVTVDTHMWLPKAIRLQEPNGDDTLFELTYHTINDPLPADTFLIDIPKGDG